MGLPKGKTNNPDGRPAGSKNKCTAELRNLITEFLNDNFEQVKQDFQDMQPQDRLHFYTKLLQFALPRPTENTIKLDELIKTNPPLTAEEQRILIEKITPQDFAEDHHKPVQIIFSDIEAENLALEQQSFNE